MVYPVLLNRELDQRTLDRAWAARIQKLQKAEVQARQPGGGGAPPSLDTPRLDSWWSFHVVSRSWPRTASYPDLGMAGQDFTTAAGSPLRATPS